MPETNDDHQPADGESSPSDAFGLVGNEIRAEIIRTLGDARVEERHPPVVSFSELRSRADTDIGSSQFNYHLQQLVGQYLKRDDDGYQMRTEGRELYQTLRAGTFDAHEDIRTVDADFECYYCTTPVEAILEDGTITIHCRGCDYMYAIAGAPPEGIEEGTLALEQIERYYHHRHLAFARGVCITCGSALNTDLIPIGDLPFADADRQKLYVYRFCDNCGDQRHLSLGTALLTDPELRAFCLDHGVDVLSTPLWKLEFAATDHDVTVRSTDPWEVALTISYGDDTLELVVDEDITVLERNQQ